MIKKLRTRFIFVIMALAVMMILIVLAGIMGFMTYSEARISNAIIDTEFLRQGSEGNSLNPQGFEVPNGWDFSKKSTGQNSSSRGETIYVRLDSDYVITYMDLRMLYTDEELLQEIGQTVTLIFNGGTYKKTGQVECGGETYRYKISEAITLDSFEIVLLNIQNERLSNTRLLRTLIMTGLLIVLVMFLISNKLADMLIKPIADAFERQKQFVSDASHELRTPLTVIATNVDAILSNPDNTVNEQGRWLKLIKKDALRMGKLVSDLLFIAKSDNNQRNFIKADFDLSFAVSDVALAFEVFIFENGKFLETDIDENIWYKGDEGAIKQLLTILVDNAVKYSPKGAAIIISLRRERKIVLSVVNTGSEIARNDAQKIFERFYRSDKSRTKATGGFGLGLSIAKAIVDSSKGTISCQSKDGSVTFKVEL